MARMAKTKKAVAKGKAAAKTKPKPAAKAKAKPAAKAKAKGATKAKAAPTTKAKAKPAAKPKAKAAPATKPKPKPAAKAKPVAKAPKAAAPTAPAEPDHGAPRADLAGLEAGMTFVYAFGDEDAGDKYVMKIEDAGDPVRFHWQLQGVPDNGFITVAPASLAPPKGVLWFSQGSVIGGHDEIPVPERTQAVSADGYLPPFATWREGTFPVAIAFSDCIYHPTDETESREVALNGETIAVSGRWWRTTRGDAEALVSQDGRVPGLLSLSSQGGDSELQLLSLDR
jgi:hypothetical protein